jgi:hypothetical protein
LQEEHYAVRYYRYTECGDYDFASIVVSDLPDGSDAAQIHWEDWPRAPSWTPLRIADVVDVEDGMKQEVGDFPMGVFLPIFSARAWEILSRRIECRWEALPLSHPRLPRLCLIHVMETIDCVDLDRSEFYRYPSGRVGRIQRFCLKPEKLEGKHIFKTSAESGHDLLVDDVFREVVQQEGLRGLKFRQGLIPLVGSAEERETFRDEDEARYTQLAGRPIRTVNDLAATLKDGTIQPGQVPVNYVIRRGRNFLLKGLDWAALVRAGVPESEWVRLDQTGNQVPGMRGTTFDDMARIQAEREDAAKKAGKKGARPNRRR